jgi:hypothetical protein
VGGEEEVDEVGGGGADLAARRAVRVLWEGPPRMTRLWAASMAGVSEVSLTTGAKL